jgi:hypothetical protein
VLNITIDWGLMVCAVDLIVPKIVSSVWSGGRLFMGLPVAAALTHFEKQTKRGHVETKDAVHIQCIHISFTSWHAICSGMLKMGGRNVYSKSFVHSQKLQGLGMHCSHTIPQAEDDRAMQSVF